MVVTGFFAQWIVKEALRPYQQHLIQMQNIKMHRMAFAEVSRLL